MEFRQLEALKLIVDTGSFSQTAQQMGVTQPTVSSQISALEREFGCTLLTRQPGGAMPTEAGAALYRHAADILALRDKAVACCGRHREMSGTLNIAASSIPCQFVLPILAAQFSMQYPGARFSITSGDSASSAERVLAGQAQLGMVGAVFPDEALAYQAILEDELMLMTPAAPPYTQWGERCVKAEEIANAPFVAREYGSGTWAAVERYFKHRGCDTDALRVVGRIDHLDAIVSAVEQGMGITILSSLAANAYVQKGHVLIFPLADGPVKRKIYLVRRKEGKTPAVTEAFFRFVSRRANEA